MSEANTFPTLESAGRLTCSMGAQEFLALFLNLRTRVCDCMCTLLLRVRQVVLFALRTGASWATRRNGESNQDDHVKGWRLMCKLLVPYVGKPECLTLESALWHEGTSGMHVGSWVWFLEGG